MPIVVKHTPSVAAAGEMAREIGAGESAKREKVRREELAARERARREDATRWEKSFAAAGKQQEFRKLQLYSQLAAAEKAREHAKEMLVINQNMKYEEIDRKLERDKDLHSWKQRQEIATIKQHLEDARNDNHMNPIQTEHCVNQLYAKLYRIKPDKTKSDRKPIEEAYKEEVFTDSEGVKWTRDANGTMKPLPAKPRPDMIPFKDVVGLFLQAEPPENESPEQARERTKAALLDAYKFYKEFNAPEAPAAPEAPPWRGAKGGLPAAALGMTEAKKARIISRGVALLESHNQDEFNKFINSHGLSKEGMMALGREMKDRANIKPRHVPSHHIGLTRQNIETNEYD